MNILIVDDNEANLYFLEALLKGNGHEVRSATNGTEALETLHHHGSDLIISDILMPVMDGFQFCRIVKTDAGLRDIPFIFYTAEYTSPGDADLAIKIGAARVITKPCEPEAFMAAIEAVMAASHRVDSAVNREAFQEEDVLRTHNERLVSKLEQKVAQLEKEIQVRKEAERNLRNALDTIKQLKARLEAENIYLRDEMKLKDHCGGIIGDSDPIKYTLRRIQQVAPTDVTVLLTGETGTGKGLFAHYLHQKSRRKDRAFINVNCAGLPANLIESELFGREKGAFTGSVARQIGRFELANGGTIFLDEIGELPVELQAKLLKVIEDGEFERLGSPYTVKVDVRVIASTNRNLEREISNGRFRQDLFYRLNVFPVTISPLRERKEDIPALVGFYKERFVKKFGKRIDRISPETMQAFQNYNWPGNVRELINVLEKAILLSEDRELRLVDKLEPLPFAFNQTKDDSEIYERKELVEVERDHILKTLQERGWRIEGPKGAARILGINPNTLRSRMNKLGIKRPDMV